MSREVRLFSGNDCLTLAWLVTVSLMTLLGAVRAFADPWKLEPAESALYFQTIKAGSVGETHAFRELSGALASDGALTVEIKAASVDSGIPVRDQRLRDLLFKVAEFPTIRVTAQVPLADFEAMPIGTTLTRILPLELSLLAESEMLTAEVSAARLSEDRMLVSTRAPVLVSASAFQLGAAVEQLRTIAGLPSITSIVPVSLTSTWRRSDEAAGLGVTEARVREPLPGTSRTAGYFELHNPTEASIAITAARSPVAAKVELHETVRLGDRLRMQRLEAVELAPGERLVFEPGGRHLMFFQVQAALPETVELTLSLSGAELPAGFEQTISLRRFSITD